MTLECWTKRMQCSLHKITNNNQQTKTRLTNQSSLWTLEIRVMKGESLRIRIVATLTANKFWTRLDRVSRRRRSPCSTILQMVITTPEAKANKMKMCHLLSSDNTEAVRTLACKNGNNLSDPVNTIRIMKHAARKKMYRCFTTQIAFYLLEHPPANQVTGQNRRNLNQVLCSQWLWSSLIWMVCTNKMLRNLR